jgi:hypothetical protein
MMGPRAFSRYRRRDVFEGDPFDAAPPVPATAVSAGASGGDLRSGALTWSGEEPAEAARAFCRTDPGDTSSLWLHQPGRDQQESHVSVCERPVA